MVVAIVEFKLLGTVIMKSYIRIIFVLAASLMATHALSQDISGWSDKTVCRLVASDGGAPYVEETVSRGLDCKAPTKAKPTKPKSKSSSRIERFGGIGEIPWNANPNYETLKYYLHKYLYYSWIGPGDHRLWEVKASNNPYNFQSDLREEKYIKKQMQKTALLSYLLYEDGKIVIDEITPKDRFGDMYFESSKFGSASLGKSLVSYITGHAICAGYIESVDSRLNDWPLIRNTLYHNQKLINLLNMAAGDQASVDGMSGYLTNSRRWINNQSITSIMNNELNGSKKAYAKYNYNNLATNTIGAYVVFKTGDSFQELIDDIFKKKVRIKDDVFFRKNQNANYGEETFWYHFMATRSDFLRIGKAMLDDWQNDTCEGQYLKTIYEKRINKNEKWKDVKSSALNPQSYGGQFHMEYQGMKNRPVIGLNGFGGQGMLIDFERGRIIATQAIHENFNWSQLVHKPIRDGKPASISTVKLKQQAEPVIDPQQLLLDRETNQAVERLAKEYWDNYYESIDESNNRKSQRILFGGSADGLTMLSEDFEIKGQRDIRVDDRNSKWYIKQDNDGNSVYCNKVTNGWTDFNFGSAGWSDYSISYRMKFSTGKGGTTETHIRKMGDRDYRARISSYGGVEIQLKNSTIARGYVSTKTGEWLDIQLTASGDNIKYLVDGEVVASAKDDRVKKGAGMIAVSANAEVCIDDIAVKEI
jgi:hypothetical protein